MSWEKLTPGEIQNWNEKSRCYFLFELFRCSRYKIHKKNWNDGECKRLLIEKVLEGIFNLQVNDDSVWNMNSKPFQKLRKVVLCDEQNVDLEVLILIYSRAWKRKSFSGRSWLSPPKNYLSKGAPDPGRKCLNEGASKSAAEN